jgi:hypothetical protein
MKLLIAVLILFFQACGVLNNESSNPDYKTIFGGLLEIYCRSEKELKDHIKHIELLSTSARSFANDSEREAFDKDLKEKRKNFWLKIKSQAKPADIPKIEKALKGVGSIWSQDELKSLPMNCEGDPKVIMSEVIEGYKS